ncbi:MULTISPECIES: hypothetical protein [Pseudomonas]|uniref:Uncharacterized protein n=1 Tax=Pseudomonas putida TaxID=303 RepID=A0A6S5D8A5_PSEPU|nr:MULTISPECIES: hypothetical protein [Pseudomonas]MBH3359915.1 hypothetical protein [Pseudomonas guariconensis]MCO7622381.1 hypothetical protein [Pseudomonas guariconensis]MDM9595363.1 hypothetical protein [Pseudomonas guariconensis]MDM9608193.1 hypothetical protein [Pseudomonas guariconensis]MDM9613150.1 hypothetical protein [Pseudomonas guariconensis]
MTDLKSKLATATSSLLRRRPANTKVNMHGKACTPKYSLDPKLEQRLTTWEDLDDRDLFLAHPVTLECFLSSDLSRRTAEDVIEECDVFSTSLASYGNPASVPWTRGVGLILDINPQNILGTFTRPVGLPFHGRTSKYQLAHSIEAGISQSGKIIKGGYRKIMTPEELLKYKNVGNEVLVIGRPNTHVHFAQTRKINVKGVVIVNRNDSEKLREDFNLIRLLRVQNPGLEVYSM